MNLPTSENPSSLFGAGERGPQYTMNVRFEQDVVTARQKARRIAEQMGFESQDQTRIATSVSEIVRNAFRYAGAATISFGIELSGLAQRMIVVVEDHGKGIPDVESVLSGQYHSSTGMGLGILGTKRLMDTFDITTSPNGTRIIFSKSLPARVRGRSAGEIEEIFARIGIEQGDSAIAEVQRQNQALLQTLQELNLRQEELNTLNHELEDTNRGVVALYAELDEKADHLRRSDEIKSKFLSNISHEFRTPLNAIVALSRILMERTDGELSSEQEIQVGFIRKAAHDLIDLVNDLLDLAKVEAGKIEIHPASFEIENLFGALRGMLKSLLVNEAVELVFEDASALPKMFSDEGKISQILRNLISNSLKFTDRGEVRVCAKLSPDARHIHFQVTDTGIGVPAEHLELIFQEFTQVETAQHGKIKGTGLGLPLSQKLAELLGGELTVQSCLGKGSIFTATLPITVAELPSTGDGIR